MAQTSSTNHSLVVKWSKWAAQFLRGNTKPSTLRLGTKLLGCQQPQRLFCVSSWQQSWKHSDCFPALLLSCFFTAWHTTPKPLLFIRHMNSPEEPYGAHASLFGEPGTDAHETVIKTHLLEDWRWASPLELMLVLCSVLLCRGVCVCVCVCACVCVCEGVHVSAGYGPVSKRPLLSPRHCDVPLKWEICAINLQGCFWKFKRMFSRRFHARQKIQATERTATICTGLTLSACLPNAFQQQWRCWTSHFPLKATAMYNSVVMTTGYSGGIK